MIMSLASSCCYRPRVLPDGKQTKLPRNTVVATFVGACLNALVEVAEFRYDTSCRSHLASPRRWQQNSPRRSSRNFLALAKNL